MLLLVAFPEIAKGILFLSEWVSAQIDPHGGLSDIFYSAAKAMDELPKKSTGITKFFSATHWILAVLNWLSFWLLISARYLIWALHHFLWALMNILAPIFILFNLFPATSQLTKNLFSSMCEVASWKIIWSIMAVLFTTMPYSKYYEAYGNDVGNLIMVGTINIIIAACMIFTPLIVKALTSGSVSYLTSSLYMAVPYRPIRSVINMGQKYMKKPFTSNTRGGRSPRPRLKGK